MIDKTSCIRAVAGAALLAGIAVLSGCGPAPYNHTTTSESTTTTIPSPVVSMRTTRTEQDSQRR
jgi:hypothetical protein